MFHYIREASASGRRVAFGHAISRCRAMRRGVALEVTRTFGRPRARDALHAGVPGIFAHSRAPPVGYERVRPFHLVTKRVARDKPSVQDVRAALRMLADEMDDSRNVDVLFLPRIGCGLDKLEWEGSGGVREVVLETFASRVGYNLEVVMVSHAEDDGKLLDAQRTRPDRRSCI